METFCHLDGTLFPFDSQACNIIVQSWAYSKDFVDLRNPSAVVHMEGFEGHGKQHNYRSTSLACGASRGKSKITDLRRLCS